MTLPLNLYTVTSILASLFCWATAALARFQGRPSRERDFFALISFLVGVWTLFPFLTSITSDPEWQARFARLVYIAASFVPMTFMFLVDALLSHPSPRFRLFCKLSQAVAFIFAALSLHPLYIAGVQSSGSFRAVEAGPLYHLFVLYFSGFFTYSLTTLAKGALRSTGVKRNQLLYVFIGFVVACLGGGIHFLAVYIHSEPFPHDVLVILFIAILAYAIVRYKLMDITLAFRNAMIQGLVALAVSAPLVAVIALTESLWVAVAALGLLFFGVKVFSRRLEFYITRVVDRLPLFKGKYDRFNTIEQHVQRIGQSGSVDRWGWSIMKSAHELYDVVSGSILMKDEKMNCFIIKAGFGLNQADMTFLSLDFSNPITQYLRRERTIILREMARQTFHKDKLEEAEQTMDFLHAMVTVPLFYQGELYAVLNLGEKTFKGMFNDLDFANLNNLSRGAEQALQVVLSGLTQEQNSSVWAHDLIHPFGTKGSFQFLEEIIGGAFGPISDEIKFALQMCLKDVHFVAKHMGKVLNPALAKDEFQIAPHSPIGVLSRIREKYTITSIKSGIQWIVRLPPQNLQALFDPDMLEYRVLANLVENAFRHTPTGGTIEVGYRLEGDAFIGYVRDTGIGIRKEDLPKIFEKGVQLEDGSKGISGLGLYSVANVIKAHKGKVWVESEFGQGSTFYFQLPLAAK